MSVSPMTGWSTPAFVGLGKAGVTKEQDVNDTSYVTSDCR
jgi:hypothetical protein